MRILILLLATISLFGLDNKQTNYEKQGVQELRPYTFEVSLGQGEVPNFARPAPTLYDSLGNVTSPRSLSTHWQADRKTQWRDKMTSVAITSVVNPAAQPVCPAPMGPCNVTPYVRVVAPNHTALEGETVTISNSSTPEINGTWNITDRDDAGFSLASLASVASPGATTGTATMPDYGSWETGNVTVFASVPVNGRIEVEFVNSPDRSSVPANMGLTQAETLALTWDSFLIVKAPTVSTAQDTFTVSARAIFTAWDGTERDCGIRKWEGGPVKTTWIVEDSCAIPGPQTYDFGWTPVGGTTGIKLTSDIPIAQSDGTQTFTVDNAANVDYTNGPVEWLWMTGGPHFLGANIDIEVLRSSGKSGNTITVSNNGRGLYGTNVRGAYRRYSMAQSVTGVNISTDTLTVSSSHRFTEGQAVGVNRISVSGSSVLPVPLAADTTYYARNVTATSLQLSLTSGGAPIDLTVTGTLNLIYLPPGTDTLNIISGHMFRENDPVEFVMDSGSYTLPAPLTLGTTYYVRNVTATSLQVSATPGGAPVNITGTGLGASNIIWAKDSLPRAVTGGNINPLQYMAADDAHKAFHPMFIISTYRKSDGTAYEGVKIETVLNNNTATSLGTQYISAEIQTSGPTSRWKSGELNLANPAQYFFMSGATRFIKTFWDGTDPDIYSNGGVLTRKWLRDINMHYLVSAGFMMPFDERTPATGAGSPFESDYNRFIASNRADVAVPMSYSGSHNWISSTDGTSTNKYYQYTLRWLGFATYSVEESTPPKQNYAGSHDEDREEGGYWSRQYARTLPILGTEPRAWEILYGTSVPGGAGLRRAENHLPFNLVERGGPHGDTPPSANTCPDCNATGRVVSLDARPDLYMQDITDSCCTATYGLGYSTWTTDVNNWWYFKAFNEFIIAYANLDHAHRMPFSYWSYHVTGDYMDLVQTQNWASFQSMFFNPTHASLPSNVLGAEYRKGNWGSLLGGKGHPRQTAWRLMILGQAARLSPSEPPFGQTYRPPEKHLYRRTLVETFRIWEGFAGVTNGAFPPSNPTCNGITWSVAQTGVTTWTTADRWCWARQEFGRNQVIPRFIMFPPEFTGPGSTGDSSKAAHGITPFNLFQNAQSFGHVVRTKNFPFIQPMFQRFGKFWANYFINTQTSNFYRSVYYQAPGHSDDVNTWTYAGLDGTETIPPRIYFPSWGAWVDSFAAAYKNPTGYDSSSRTDIEYGYANYARGGGVGFVNQGIADTETPGCRLTEKPPSGCTADAAYTYITSFVAEDQAGYQNYKRMALKPGKYIRNISVTPGTTTASIVFSAPTTAACKYTYGAGTAPPTSSDAADSLTAAGSTTKTVNLTGLAQGTTHYFRSTCEDEARSVLNFTTTTEGGTITISTVPTSRTFTAQQGGSNPAPQTTATTCTGGACTVQASPNQVWLNASVEQTGASTATVTISANISGLTAGTYNGTVTISAPEATGTAEVTVTLTVTPIPTPTLSLTPSTLSFGTAIIGAPSPSPQAALASCTELGCASYSSSGSCTWATLGIAGSTLTVTPNTTALAAGSYSCSWNISGAGAVNNPQVLTATVDVTARSSGTSGGRTSKK